MRKNKGYLLDLNKKNGEKEKMEKWVNYIMFNGKKEKAEKNMCEILLKLKKKYKKNPVKIMHEIFEKMDTPIGLYKKNKRSPIKVPKLLSKSRRFFQGVNPIIKLAKKLKGRKWSESVYLETEKVYNNESVLIKQMKEVREEIYACRTNAFKRKRR
jgi:ribosomal protein S7